MAEGPTARTDTAGSTPRQGSTSISTTETYGFLGWITSSVLYCVFLAWAFTPDPILRLHGITWYPSKYWAVAVPVWLCVTLGTAFVLYECINWRHGERLKINQEVENELESNLRSLHANYAGVSTTLRDENLHAIDVPFIVPSPSELLMDVLASKAPVGIPTLSSDVTGTIALLVCTDDQGAISAISTKVSIGSMRNVSITMQELYDCGLLLTPEREPSLCLLTVVSRVWRSLGCVESPQKAKLREKQRKEKEGRISRPPVIKRAEVATFVQDRGPGAAERDITDKDVADCLSSCSANGLAWLADARLAVSGAEDANKELAAQVMGLERQLAVLNAELLDRTEEFREKNARREELRRVLAPDVLRERLEADANMANDHGEALSSGWARNPNGAFNVREYVDSMAAVYALRAAAKLVAGNDAEKR